MVGFSSITVVEIKVTVSRKKCLEVFIKIYSNKRLSLTEMSERLVHFFRVCSQTFNLLAKQSKKLVYIECRSTMLCKALPFKAGERPFIFINEDVYAYWGPSYNCNKGR